MQYLFQVRPASLLWTTAHKNQQTKHNTPLYFPNQAAADQSVLESRLERLKADKLAEGDSHDIHSSPEEPHTTTDQGDIESKVEPGDEQGASGHKKKVGAAKYGEGEGGLGAAGRDALPVSPGEVVKGKKKSPGVKKSKIQQVRPSCNGLFFIFPLCL